MKTIAKIRSFLKANVGELVYLDFKSGHQIGLLHRGFTRYCGGYRHAVVVDVGDGSVLAAVDNYSDGDVAVQWWPLETLRGAARPTILFADTNRHLELIKARLVEAAESAMGGRKPTFGKVPF